MHSQGFRSQSIYAEDEPKRTSAVPRKRSWFRLPARLRKKPGSRFDALVAWIKKPRTRRQWLMLLLKTAGILFGAGIVLLIVLWFTLPNIDDPATMFPSQSTVIL